MEENFQDLQKEWERKLAAEGLPSGQQVNKREKVPIDFVSDMVTRESGYTETQIDRVFDLYEDLPKEIQQNILDDLRKKRDNGLTRMAIMDRFAMLITKGHELVALPEDKSDEEYVPAPTRISEELQEEKEVISERVDDIIERAEQIIKRDNTKPPSAEPVN